MICYMTAASVTIDKVLSFVGIIGIIAALIRIVWVLFVSNTEWASNISIREIKDDEDAETAENGDCIFPVEYHAGDEMYMTRIMFRPRDSIVRKMKLSRIVYADSDFRKGILVKEKVFKNITPQKPLIIGVEMAEIFPQYSLSWSGDYGVKARYYFCINGRDGNYRLSGMTYTIGFWAKARKILGLK